MLKKTAARNAFLDKLHRGGVWFFIGLTGVSGVVLGKRLYDYFTHDKPELLRQRELLQKDLLMEGSPDKALLKDNAPQLNI